MAGHGAGPSRRSHTKSRKGCKTCKRRHIRCDETFPQCRNCTKHQVRCDYMENLGSDSEGQSSPEQPSLVLTPDSENRVDLWQQTGGFPYPNLQVFPQPHTQEYSKNELRLIHHLSSISNELQLRGTSNLTIWTQKLPKFLSIASSYPYVMHALLSFSANHLAWVHNSSETRSLHIQHGGIALRGLHEAIGSFSHANADAVLAASLLMLWQATDWRSWSSLRAGIQSVLSAMKSWKHESLFAEYIAEEDLVAASLRMHSRKPSVNTAERSSILQNTTQALQRLQMALRGQEPEQHWANQLSTYVQQLQSLNPARTPEEQFSQLYYLRKWLFWVPVSLLLPRRNQGPSLLTLAHFYATAMTLEPLFPDLGSSFCGAIALPPLEAVISIVNATQLEPSMDPNSIEIAALMQFPRQTAHHYRNHAAQNRQPMMQQPTSMSHINPDTWSYTTIGNLSPAFAPSPLHYTPHSTPSTQSPWLEVPTPQSGFGYGTQSWGSSPSPGFPADLQSTQDDQMYYLPVGSFRGGFVPPVSVWT